MTDSCNCYCVDCRDNAHCGKNPCHVTNVMQDQDLPKYSHTQVLVVHPTGESYVDEGLAELLPALWAAGMNTEWSCEGGLMPGDISTQTAFSPSMFDRFFVPGVQLAPRPSDAHIVFSSYDHAARFLSTTVEKLGRPKSFFDADVAWSMALQYLPSYQGTPRGNVVWAHGLTERITEVWK